MSHPVYKISKKLSKHRQLVICSISSVNEQMNSQAKCNEGLLSIQVVEQVKITYSMNRYNDIGFM